MGIRDKPIAPGSPWQNGYAERLIGTIRRECLDHLIVLGEAHLRWILGEFVACYNKSRTHRALSQDAPVHRAIERLGAITSRPVLGGLQTNIAESSFRHAQDCFVSGLRDEDVLVMPEPVYFGGTVDRSVGSQEIICEIERHGRKALAFPDRSACGDALVKLARRGDRIVVMGARDDSLSQFAHELLRRIALSRGSTALVTAS